MNEHAASCLTEEDLCPYIQIDAELPVEEATFELVNELHALEPYGAGKSAADILYSQLANHGRTAFNW